MAGNGKRASFGSFRIAVLLRLWLTILILENDVCIGNKRMILFAKRFRSKAPLAASLSLGQFVNHRRIGFDFRITPYYDTASKGEREGL